MPFAARVTDICSHPRHGEGPVIVGEGSVLIGYCPAACVGSAVICGDETPDAVRVGEPTVQIGHKDAARMGDPTGLEGVIASGCPTVLIGSTPQANALRTNKPFCEECEKKRESEEP